MSLVPFKLEEVEFRLPENFQKECGLKFFSTSDSKYFSKLRALNPHNFLNI